MNAVQKFSAVKFNSMNHFTRVLPLKSRYVDTWTSISKIRTAKAEFLGSFRALDILLPQNSALAVMILIFDTYVYSYLSFNETTLVFMTYWSKS